MSRYCLDTSAYSQFKRGVREAVHLIDEAEWIGLPVVTLAELRVGLLLGRRQRQNEAELEDFMSNPVVQALGIDAEIAQHYAEIVVDLLRSGTPVPTNDVWIAATAARHGATVLSADLHYEAISRVGSVVISNA